jgi:hypothetical protein
VKKEETSNLENVSDRELARDLGVSEDDARQERKKRGFLKLDDFQDQKEVKNSLDIDAELDDMEKRKLQGHLGEKLTSLMKSRVTDYLESHTKPEWVLRDKLQLISSASVSKRYWASGKPRQGSIRIDGRSIKHTGESLDEIEKYVKERCVFAEEDMFEKFKEVRNPFIDFNFYAVKKTGKRETEFILEDYSSDSFDAKESMKVSIPVIEDFKVIMLEVKTTKDEAETLFSSNQRKARDLAKNSPYLDFFSLQVDREFSELNIPKEYSVNIQKHS